MNENERRHEPRAPDGRRYDFYSLCLATGDELEKVMRMGVVPDAEKLAGWEFKGWNTMELTPLLGIRKFKKGFFKRQGKDRMEGYNVVVIQNNLGQPWIDRLKAGRSIRHCWYEVYPVRLDEIDNRYPNALLINYGASGRNFALNPARLLRDYLVQVYEDNPDLYLGKAYLAFGPLRVFQSYFVLERNNRSDLSER